MRVRQLIIATLALSFGLGAASDEPANKPDETWTSLSGTVTSAGPESFRMNYGDGIVTVEMEDWETYGEEFILTKGDHATVFGEVDKDFYEEDSVEASSLYVEDLNSYFYASDIDAENLGDWIVKTPVEPGETTYIGNVTSVDESAGTFTIDSGKRALTVDTTSMPYNPLDDEGYQRIDKGERVSVNGSIDRGFHQDRRIEAETVVTLRDDLA